MVAVGPEADARIAAATDDSPIAVSGWLLGSEHRRCPDTKWDSPAPNGVDFDDCVAVPLRASQDGGATLPLHFDRQDPPAWHSSPAVTQVMRILVQVHVRDAGCSDADCVHKAVFDKVLMYGSPLISPPVLAATMPPGGISTEQAIAAARAYDVQTRLGFGEPKVLLSAEAGPLIVVAPEEWGDGADLAWIWVVRFASDDGGSNYEVYVDFLDGLVSGARGSSPGMGSN